MRKIRVLVVEDSLVFRQLLVENLNKDPAIEVVATASNPYEARDAIVAHRPSVMTLDVELPKMSGIEFLKKLMPQYPIPTVVISSMSDKVFDAMQAGAVEFVVKPVCMDHAHLDHFIKNELLVKIKIASIAKVGNRKQAVEIRQQRQSCRASVHPVIAIGASTGGTEAIATIIKEFRQDIPGVVVVQHMPPGFTGMYAKRLNDQCSVLVKEACNGDWVLPGQVLIAPGGDEQMQLVEMNGKYQVVLKPGPKVNGHCPSVDVLFESVARTAGVNGIGVLLTGMGGDGARGLLSMKRAGARTIGQDESTCVVYGMPKIAYELGAVDYQEKLDDIARRVYGLLSKRK